MKKKTSRKIEDCHPKLQTAFTEGLKIWLQKYPDRPVPFITCSFRSNEDQEILYQMSRNGIDDDKDGKIDEADEWRSNAKAGTSKHNRLPAEAFDIAFKEKNGSLNWSEFLFKDFADIVKTYGIEWGGDWIKSGKSKRNDSPHFQI